MGRCPPEPGSRPASFGPAALNAWNVTPTSSPARPAGHEPEQQCIRCGAPVPVNEAMCRACNPAGLKQPAASQAHGTAVLGIALAVVGMAVAATFLVGGVGPFRATVNRAAPAGSGLVLTLDVENAGTRAGHASCRVWDPAYLGNPPLETFIRTPEIPARGRLTFDQRVNALGGDERTLAVECSR